jgi:hypothetical protein
MPAARPAEVVEARVLARQAADAFRDEVERYKDDYKLSHQEAVARAEEPYSPAHVANLVLGPPDQVSFYDLERLGKHNPELMQDRWEGIKEAARDDLQTGGRAAAAAEGFGPHCWQRAQFAAVLSALTDDWRPRGGVERLLLDQMALAHTALLDWMKTHAALSACDSGRRERRLKEGGWPEPPRLSDAEAVEQAATMVDRFSRIFLRTLRALCNLRKVTPAVVVQNAGQVNVGGQQVNVAEAGA